MSPQSKVTLTHTATRFHHSAQRWRSAPTGKERLRWVRNPTKLINAESVESNDYLVILDEFRVSSNTPCQYSTRRGCAREDLPDRRLSDYTSAVANKPCHTKL